jgi:hypothetical protein
MKRSPQPFVCPGAPDAFLPCCFAVVALDAGLSGRGGPPAPQEDRFVLAQAEPRPAGALLVLVHLRKGEIFAGLAAGFGVGTTTAWRYVQETVTLLAARAPRLDAALQAAKQAKCAFVVLDGILIPIDRLAADRPFYSGKHRRHGMNLQVIGGPDGEILWVSGALPSAVHDLTAARIWGIVRRPAAAGLVLQQ